MFNHMKTQIENPTLANSRFMFNEVLFIDINFHQLNLTRGSFYLSLPNPLANKRAIINPKNESDEECFKWAVIAALHYVDIKTTFTRCRYDLKTEQNHYGKASCLHNASMKTI